MRPARHAWLIREEEDQIQPAALDAAELDALRAAGDFRHRRLRAQELGDLVFENDLGGLLFAETLPDAEEQLLANLLADREARAGALLALRLDLELVESRGRPRSTATGLT